MEDRIKQLITEEDAGAGADTFADRAEAYYRRRPRLMALLHDLYNEYVSVADRYTRALTKLNHSHASPTTTDLNDEGYVSDAESTLSYQPTYVTPIKPQNNRSAMEGGDAVAELVMKSVEYDFLQHEMEVAARESCRKIELQKRLVEVLESERLVLLGENSRLGYRAEMLAEETKVAAAENVFLKRRANQLARCVMEIQEDRRAEVVSQQIEDLQRQVYALEKKNLWVSIAQPRREGKKKSSSWWKKIGVGPCGWSCSSPVHVTQLG